MGTVPADIAAKEVMQHGFRPGALALGRRRQLENRSIAGGVPLPCRAIEFALVFEQAGVWPGSIVPPLELIDRGRVVRRAGGYPCKACQCQDQRHGAINGFHRFPLFRPAIPIGTAMRSRGRTPSDSSEVRGCSATSLETVLVLRSTLVADPGISACPQILGKFDGCLMSRY